jgi:hypothetical protein
MKSNPGPRLLGPILTNKNPTSESKAAVIYLVVTNSMIWTKIVTLTKTTF